MGDIYQREAEVETRKSKIGSSLQAGLRTRIVGSHIIFRKRVASTMDIAAEYAARGYPEGTVVFAEEQTAGRGRFGAKWWSPPGASLLFSVALWPQRAKVSPTLLTIAGAVAVAETLRRTCALDARIRWPNDITVGDRKISGVLVETKRVGRLHPLIVVGIGLNLNMKKKEMPPDLAKTATSVVIECGRKPNYSAVARALLRALDRWYVRLLEQGAPPLIKRWCALSSTLGRRVVVKEGGKFYRGRVTRITSAGELAVDLDGDGERLFRAERTTLVTEEVP